MTQALSYEKDHDRPLSVFDVVWVMLVLVLLCTTGTGHAQERALENLKETGKAFASVAKEVSPAVVFI